MNRAPTPAAGEGGTHRFSAGENNDGAEMESASGGDRNLYSSIACLVTLTNIIDKNMNIYNKKSA
jgi:hypothetical protein